MKQRYLYLDWLCGFFIIHMILGHISQSQYAQVEDKSFFILVNRLFFFFMPWFFFKNGMFFKKDSNYKGFNKKSFRRLMIPFIIFSLIGEPLYWIHISFTEHSNSWQWYFASIKTFFTHGQLQGNGPLWFLLSLFLIRIFYNRFCHNCAIKISIILLSFIFLCYSHQTSWNLFLSVTHTLSGLIYFSLGDLMRTFQFNKFIFIISACVFILIFVFVPIDSYVLYGNAVFPDKNYNWIFLYSLVAIIVCHNLLERVPIKYFLYLPLQKIGQDSMTYYVTHILILTGCRILCSDILGLEQWLYFTIMIVTCIFTLPVLALFFKKDRYRKYIGG